MPSALARRRASQPARRIAAAVPPKMPQIAVGWKPRLWNAPDAAMPTRVTISFPATIAVSSACPSTPSASPTAARRRHDDRAHVGHGVGVRVVVVEAVAEHRVRERGVRAPGCRAVADHRRLRISSQLGHGRAAFGRDAEPVRGEAAAERVEHVELRRLDHVGRDVVVRERRREGGDALRGSVMTPPLRSSRCRCPGTCRAPRRRRAGRP